MKALFINPTPEKCGVHQYGLRLFSIMVESVKYRVDYSTMMTADQFSIPDVVIYNWHPIIDPGCEVVKWPRFEKCKRVIIYHDGVIPVDADAFLFSSPVGDAGQDKWHMIGRPLPEWIPIGGPTSDKIIFGVSGFCGGWAADAVSYILSAYPSSRIRLHLPYSHWCDTDGATARSTADSVKAMLGPDDELEIEHNFLTQQDMLAWLSCNHVNCYIRNQAPSIGISSALDNALAVRRPIVINKNRMFRYLHDLKPSICIEDTQMRDIIRNGVAPLIPVYQRNDRKVVLAELEKILLSL